MCKKYGAEIIEIDATGKKLGVLSVGKIAAALYFLFGVVSIIVIAILKKVAANITIPAAANLASLEQLTTGTLLLIPIWQAIVGFIAGIIIAALYNLLAKKIGGIKIEI